MESEPSSQEKKGISRKRLVLWTILIGLILLYINTCTVQSPFVFGKVVDKTTGKPVPDAWIWATLQVTYGTFAGGTTGVKRVSPAHLRTNKNGRFLIPYDLFVSPPLFPIVFGAKSGKFFITVRSFDDRYAKVEYTSRINHWRFFTFVTIPVEPYPLKGDEERRDLSLLYKYCHEGRYFVEEDSVYDMFYPKPIRCDTWERDYLIRKNERIIEQIGVPRTSDEEGAIGFALSGLAYLYEQKGELQKSLDTFRIISALDIKRGVKLNIKEYERKIKELEQKVK